MVGKKRIGVKLLLTVIAIAGCVAGFAGRGDVARAAKPNNQACLGIDFSGYASGGVAFGQFNAFLAQYVPGLGLPIQVHLAGGIPDSYIVNSCND